MARQKFVRTREFIFGDVVEYFSTTYGHYNYQKYAYDRWHRSRPFDIGGTNVGTTKNFVLSEDYPVDIRIDVSDNGDVETMFINPLKEDSRGKVAYKDIDAYSIDIDRLYKAIVPNGKGRGYEDNSGYFETEIIDAIESLINRYTEYGDRWWVEGKYQTYEMDLFDNNNVEEFSYGYYEDIVNATLDYSIYGGSADIFRVPEISFLLNNSDILREWDYDLYNFVLNVLLSTSGRSSDLYIKPLIKIRAVLYQITLERNNSGVLSEIPTEYKNFKYDYLKKPLTTEEILEKIYEMYVFDGGYNYQTDELDEDGKEVLIKIYDQYFSKSLKSSEIKEIWETLKTQENSYLSQYSKLTDEQKKKIKQIMMKLKFYIPKYLKLRKSIYNGMNELQDMISI
jgi:hypothetical protein